MIAFIGIAKLQAQNKQYAYYLNGQMEIVAKEQATIMGKGVWRDSILLVQFHTIPNDRPFLIAMFKDSSLNILHGNRLTYHSNRQKAANSLYKNNMLHGPSLKWDSTGRLTDSTVYYEDMPVYKINYIYSSNGNRTTEHEFDNTNSPKRPDEKAIVMTPDGSVLPATVWQNLLFGGKYGIRQDKAATNTFLIFRISDGFFEQAVAKDAKPTESKAFKTGQKFVIDERDIKNNRLRSKDLLGNVLVINYWFINCKPCRMEMPDLNTLVEEFKDSANVKFIAIGLDDKASINDFLKLTPFNYQIIADGRNTAQRHGVMAYPTHVIIDKSGKVYFHTVSSPRQLMHWMRKTINELLQQP